jgi:hypothetical protein
MPKDTQASFRDFPRSIGFVDRYRLYLDESGDHVYREVNHPGHRFLCLVGCWFQNSAYLDFHHSLEKLKAEFLPHHPDEPVVLHREDMVNARKAFSVFRDPALRSRWDQWLLELIASAKFLCVGVVIDKLKLKDNYGDASPHPYHLGLGFLLQRYIGYLNHVSCCGDVMAEARGGTEDRLLKDSYTRLYGHGVWMTHAHVFQSALTSKELKLKTKTANISGLQLADLLSHPIKDWILGQHGLRNTKLAPFAKRMTTIAETKLNRQLYSGQVEGYGYVLYPKK